MKPIEISHKSLALKKLTSDGFGLLYAKRTHSGSSRPRHERAGDGGSRHADKLGPRWIGWPRLARNGTDRPGNWPTRVHQVPPEEWRGARDGRKGPTTGHARFLGARKWEAHYATARREGNHEIHETHERVSAPTAKPASMESSAKIHRSRNPNPGRSPFKHLPGRHATMPFSLFS
jgi:hypothetical protein